MLAKISQVTRAVAIVCDFEPEESPKAVSRLLASVNQRGNKAVRDWKCTPLVDDLPEKPAALRKSSTFRAPNRALTALRRGLATSK